MIFDTAVHAKSNSSLSSPSVLTVDGPQADTFFPVCWLIFQAPPPLDIASPSHCSLWFEVFQALNHILFLVSSDLLEVIFQQSGCFSAVRWVKFCHCQQIRIEQMFWIRNIYCLATYENMWLLNKRFNHLQNVLKDSSQVFFFLKM